MIRKINDKGIAMEVAIVALLIIFALCSVLLTMAEIGVYSNKRNAETVGDRILRTKIVDDCMVAIQKDRTEALITTLNTDEKYEDYAFTASQSVDTTYLFVFEKDPQQLVLTIKFNTNNGDVIGYYAADHLPDGVSAPPPPTPEPTPTPTPAA
ncbi:MAG: hypothetical protein IJS71_02095 [Clostridia bacterium]|nr:hypothetical protein [Clostridia bacterium]